MSDGYATLVASPPWLRGLARFANGHIELDRLRAEEYWLYAERRGLLEALMEVHVPADALGFARRFGLLCTPPDATELAEPFHLWETAADTVRDLFHLHADLQRLVLGDVTPAPDARRRILRLAALLDLPLDVSAVSPERSSDQLRGLAADLLAHGISAGLRNVRLAITGSHVVGKRDEAGHVAWGEPGRFLFSPIISNPLEAAYHQLAQVLVHRLPLRTCEECGVAFAAHDQRQRFHNKRCADRNRQRRRRSGEGRQDG